MTVLLSRPFRGSAWLKLLTWGWFSDCSRPPSWLHLVSLSTGACYFHSEKWCGNNIGSYRIIIRPSDVLFGNFEYMTVANGSSEILTGYFSSIENHIEKWRENCHSQKFSGAKVKCHFPPIKLSFIINTEYVTIGIIILYLGSIQHQMMQLLLFGGSKNTNYYTHTNTLDIRIIRHLLILLYNMLVIFRIM